MFSLKTLEIVHWDWWERFTLPLDAAIVTVVGPNGSGKTTLLDALRTLLAIPCSGNRDYKRYVRRADRPYAWLRATVSNPRRANGQYAFWPITEPTVTLFCQIRKKGGDWERRYAIGRGEVPIESAEASEHVQFIGVRQYEAQLEGAGLTRAIKRVLALDQGHTDKLCEYSGRQLLDLVFDVFGDQEVLDNYRKAREDQTAVGRELNELGTQLAQLHTHLEAANANVRSYNDYQQLIAELSELQAQWLPRARLTEYADALRGGRSQLLGKRRERSEVQRLLDERRSQLAALEAKLAQLSAAEAESRQALEACQAAERRIQKPLQRASLIIEQREQLLERAAAQAQGFDIEAASRQAEQLQRRRYALEAQLLAVDQQRSELQTRLATLDAGRRPQPAEVLQFRQALDAAGIAHRMLVDIVDITDERWQAAVEAVLAGVRHLVLLDDPADRARAWQLGERLRFRHYVVPDRAPAPRASPGSLLECLRFSADPPVWLSRLLDGIQRVDSIDDGARLVDGQSWITPSGYQRERRGARDISVSDAHFGRNVAVQARQRLHELDEQRDGLAEALRLQLQRLSELQSRLAGVDAARELLARSAEFQQAETDLNQLRGEAAQLEQKRSSHATQYYALSEALRPQSAELGQLREMVAGAQRRLNQLLAEQDSARDSFRKTLEAFRNLRLGTPWSWRRAAGLAETRARYASVTAVEHEIERLQKRRTDGRFVTDPQCLTVRNKYEAEHRVLERRIDDQRVHLDRAAAATDRARAQYINVLRATLRRYAHNLKTLGALAGIDVEVGYPNLSNDDLSLGQAALEVQFNFDQKGMIGLNDGEASGGQQVMKSMILLVGLMMEDDSGGGFVFIDEPFAHLDIFNIDKVGSFLQATRAQYIVTTPNTHNVNVFKPSELTLVTQKRRAGASFAPPVAFLRRAAGDGG